MRYVNQFLKDIAYWGVSTVVSTGLPVLVGFIICRYVFELPKSLGSVYATAVGLVTVTWGAWIGLCASRSRGTAVLQRLFVSIPAVAPFIGGALTIYIGSGGLVAGGFLIAVALVLLFLAAILSGRIRAAGTLTSTAAKTFWGLVCMPVLGTALALVVLVGWYRFLVLPIGFEQLLATTDFGSILRFLVTVMAYSLVSTVIPGGVALVVNRVACASESDRSDGSGLRM